MGQRTSIEWTDATWNPTTGCTKVSAGCDNCYAASLSRRLLAPTYLRRPPVADTAANRADPFSVRIWPERLGQPGRWRKPRRVFVNSMSDLFHKDVPAAFLRAVFKVILDNDRHIYQILTKRPSRAAHFVRKSTDLFGTDGLPSHIWIGTSTEDQRAAHRIRHLEQVPATVRFLSCEPLIGPLHLCDVWTEGAIHWVIVGGESGIGHRPVRFEWVEAIRDECLQAKVPFFFKQWGGRTPKAGGRRLAGREWSEFPEETARPGQLGVGRREQSEVGTLERNLEFA